MRFPVLLRNPRVTVWLLATAVVAAVCLLGAMASTPGAVFGQTVPASPSQISTDAGTITKHRPQTAVASDGSMVSVWEETASGATNTTDLYFSCYDPGTAAWTAPAILPATDLSGAQWPAGTAVDDWFSHLQFDASDNLHVVYSERYYTATPPSPLSVYYTVAERTGPCTYSWLTPTRLDPAGSPLYNQDSIRALIRPDPSGVHAAMGYVLWTGGSTPYIRLTRVGYDAGSLTVIDPASVIGPPQPGKTGGQTAGPVAVLDQGNGTQLQLVYASKNTTTAATLFFRATLDITAGAATWPTAISLGSNTAPDCGQSGCTGATALIDSNGDTWLAANREFSPSSGTYYHQVQVTRMSAAGSVTGNFTTLTPSTETHRWPQLVYTSGGGTPKVLMVYTKCVASQTVANPTTCTGRDVYYKSYDLTTSIWSAAFAIAALPGEQKDVTTALDPTTGALQVTWQGTNQATTTSGDETYSTYVVNP